MSGPFVVAHRGASHDANENAASAILLARRLGVAAIEIDVHATADGEVVVHHDEDLSRSCGDPRRIADLTRAELSSLRQSFPDDRGIRRPEEPILSLDEALKLAAPVPLLVEIKAGSRDPIALTRRVASALRRTPDVPHRLISFERPIVEAAIAAFDPSRVGLVRNTEYGEEGWRDLLAPACGIAVLSRRIADAARIAALTAASRVPYVYALDDEASVVGFSAIGAKGIISNRPDVALAALRGAGR